MILKVRFFERNGIRVSDQAPHWACRHTGKNSPAESARTVCPHTASHTVRASEHTKKNHETSTAQGTQKLKEIKKTLNAYPEDAVREKKNTDPRGVWQLMSQNSNWRAEE